MGAIPAGVMHLTERPGGMGLDNTPLSGVACGFAIICRSSVAAIWRRFPGFDIVDLRRPTNKQGNL